MTNYNFKGIILNNAECSINLNCLFAEDSSGNLWIFRNAEYDSDSDTWVQTDTSKVSTAIQLCTSGDIGHKYCPAGATPFEWVDYVPPSEPPAPPEHDVYSIGSDLWIVKNAIYDSTEETWTQTDDTKVSLALILSSDGTTTAKVCAAGTDPFVWSDPAQNTPQTMHRIGNDIWIVNNATYDSTEEAWSQIDSTKGSTAIQFNESGCVNVLSCAAGADPFIWSSYISMLGSDVSLNNHNLIGVNQFVCQDFLGAVVATASDNIKKSVSCNISGNGTSDTIRIPSNFVNSSVFRVCVTGVIQSYTLYTSVSYPGSGGYAVVNNPIESKSEIYLQLIRNGSTSNLCTFSSMAVKSGNTRYKDLNNLRAGDLLRVVSSNGSGISGYEVSGGSSSDRVLRQAIATCNSFSVGCDVNNYISAGAVW